MISSLDIIIAIVLGYAIFIGYTRGIIKQMGAIGGFILAIICAPLLTPVIQALFIPEKDFSPDMGHALAYLISFILIMIGGIVLAHFVQGITKAIKLNWVNRLLGVMFCLFKYLLILSIIINIFQFIDKKGFLIKHQTRAQSYLYNPVEKVAPAVLPLIKKEWEKSQS